MANDKTVSKTDRSKMFADAKRADEVVDKARAALDKAMSDRSAAVKRIHDACGKGPFNFEGNVMTITKRATYEKGPDGKNTDKVASEVYFFRSAGEVESV